MLETQAVWSSCRASGQALAIVPWELRLLRYRASPVLAPLIYD